MKKTFIVIVMFLTTFLMYSCDALIAQNDTTEAVTTTQSSTTLDTTFVTTTQAPTTLPSTTTNTTTELNFDEIGENYLSPTNYSVLQDELEYVGIPSIGSPKALVFCVDFTDSPASNFGLSVQDVEKAFNGTSEEMDYESLNSYYLKSSYGKLNLTADVYGFYTASETAAYYEDQYENNYYYSVETEIVLEVLSYYDDQIDYTDYDYNNDGYIDGLYIVYSHDVSFYSGSDLWWAWQTYFWDSEDYFNGHNAYYFDGVEPNYLCWSGSEFMTYTDDDLDARTIIHETGHMMGLDDYYDYDTSDSWNSGGLGGADMMDSAMGDHGPFSKLMLGWITPFVVEDTSTVVDLLPYVESGDVILIIDEWNNSIFDEYILVSFYTPEGLYEADTDYYFSNIGLTIYHVNAQLASNPGYFSVFKNDNTDSSNKVVSYIEASLRRTVDETGYVDNTDLFEIEDQFGKNVHVDYTWTNRVDVGFYIQIVSIDPLTTELVIIFE